MIDRPTDDVGSAPKWLASNAQPVGFFNNRSLIYQYLSFHLVASQQQLIGCLILRRSWLLMQQKQVLGHHRQSLLDLSVIVLFPETVSAIRIVSASTHQIPRGFLS